MGARDRTLTGKAPSLMSLPTALWSVYPCYNRFFNLWIFVCNLAIYND
uniref:Uncharacterized protein n=1 Tax=Arundo donax TaxID=35708 RepID=A0A0A9A9B1_ARUDO